MNLISFIKDKRGSVVDPIYSSAYLLVLVFTIIIALYIWFQFQSTFALTIAGEDIEPFLTNIMNDLRSIYVSMDYVIPILVGGMMLVSFILAYKSGANIIMIAFSLIIWGIGMLLAAVFTNVYLSFTESFPTVYTEVPIMHLLMTNLKWVMLFWFAIITVLTFRKNNAEDDADISQRRYYSGQ